MSSECRLHVYDVTNSPNENANIAVSRFNNVTRYVAVGGIFHGGIEVYGDEWSYGYTTRDSGVYMCQPKDNPMYTYRETISLGKTHFSRQEVAQIIQLLKMAWRGEAYDTMTCNCNHFCAELAKRLEVDPLPGWLNRMATGAEAIYSFSSYTAEQARLAKEGTLSWWNWATGHAEAQTQQSNKSPKT